jgi:hypothetical protein
MRLRPHAVGLAVLLVCITAPAPAGAQSGDPEEGSPSGVIYEIPLDNARRDAAPTHHGGGSKGSNGGSSSAQGGADGGVRTAKGTISPIRSNNGFGSSSIVPGAVAAVAGAATGGGGKGSGGGGKGSGGGGKGSGSASGSSGGGKTQVMTSPSESLGPPKAATVAATPSKSRAYWLLGLALAVAAGLGIAGRYVARRR